MAFDHLRVVLADRLEKQLLCPKHRENGEQQPKLDRKGCEFIVAFVLNEIIRPSPFFTIGAPRHTRDAKRDLEVNVVSSLYAAT